MLQIPHELNDVSSDWLAHVLDAPVTGFKIVDAHAGTTGRAVLQLEYGAPVNLPSRLFMKLPPTDELQRAFVTSSGMGRREARFYESLSAEVPVRVPRCYFAASDDSGEAYVMLLEHLGDNGCTFQNASTRYSLDYVRLMLEEFAQLHAAYWESPRFNQDLSWVGPLIQHEIAQQLVQVALQQHGASMPPVFTAMGELYLAEADAVHALWRRGAQTLIHGDAHDANLFFDRGRPGFLDWAICAQAPGMRDVGYFLAGALAPEHRQFGRELVGLYRDRLLALGAPAPSVEELWQQYQWHAAYVWVGATVTLAMGDAWQPVNYVMASLQRLHGAMDTLDSVEAIRAAL